MERRALIRAEVTTTRIYAHHYHQQNSTPNGIPKIKQSFNFQDLGCIEIPENRTPRVLKCVGCHPGCENQRFLLGMTGYRNRLFSFGNIDENQ